MRELLLVLICLYSQVCNCGANEYDTTSELSSASNESDEIDSSNNSNNNSDNKITARDRVPKSEVQEESVYNQVAKQLAGLLVPDNRSDNQIYTEYVEFITREWDSLSEISLSRIETWTKEHVMPFVENGDVLFYPFGGPDMAYALRFFPTVHDYILVGLEPTGDFDSLKECLRNESSFISVKKAVSTYLEKGYFITSEMLSQFVNKNAVKGVLCMILLELAKLGFEIDLVENISINSEGDEVPRANGLINGLKITFSKKGEAFSRRMYYLKADLQNSFNKKPNNLKNFVKRFPFVTMVKSASYAMHDSSFSQIRDFILDNTKLLLQDDSGIPFHCFDSKWEKHIFGEYIHPTLKVFQKNKQHDLADYYATHEKAKIPFRIGYGFNQDRPNLLLAIPLQRKEEQRNLCQMLLFYKIDPNKEEKESRPLVEPTISEDFLGGTRPADLQRRTAAYSDVREDSSSGSDDANFGKEPLGSDSLLPTRPDSIEAWPLQNVFENRR